MNDLEEVDIRRTWSNPSGRENAVNPPDLRHIIHVQYSRVFSRFLHTDAWEFRQMSGALRSVNALIGRSQSAGMRRRCSKNRKCLLELDENMQQRFYWSGQTLVKAFDEDDSSEEEEEENSFMQFSICFHFGFRTFERRSMIYHKWWTCSLVNDIVESIGVDSCDLPARGKGKWWNKHHAALCNNSTEKHRVSKNNKQLRSRGSASQTRGTIIA